jgi:hypothetical protein
VAISIPEHSWWHHKDALERFARSFDPTARLALKESKVWDVSTAAKNYATTIGRTVYIPAHWTFYIAKQVIPHEVLGHVKQFRWAGFFIHPTVGIPLGLFLYFVIPFPVLLAWVRYRMELHADAKSWEYHLEHGWSPEKVRRRAEQFAEKVAGKPYVYSIPKRWARWGFRRKAEKVIRKVGR